MKRYTEWCARYSVDARASSITPHSAANFIASLALETTLSSRTISLYRSALGTYYAESLPPAGLSPLEHPVFKRLTGGINKAKRPAEAIARRARPGTVVMTAELLAELQTVIAENGGGLPRLDVMRWAATCVGTFGLLRPSEFLGVAKNRGVALRASAITFYALPSRNLPQRLLPPGSRISASPIPDRFAVELGVTKADPLAANPPLVIAAPQCVRALWEWMHLRQDLGGAPDGYLFAMPGGPALPCNNLNRFVAQWIGVARDCDPPKVTGRCWRRTGSSIMVANGTSAADIMAAGRWRSPQMIAVYSDPAAARERAIAASRAMGAAAAPPAAASGHR